MLLNSVFWAYSPLRICSGDLATAAHTGTIIKLTKYHYGI